MDFLLGLLALHLDGVLAFDQLLVVQLEDVEEVLLVLDHHSYIPLVGAVVVDELHSLQ